MVDERAAGQDVDLTRLESGKLPGQLREPLGYPRRAQDLGDGLGLLLAEMQQRPGLVGILAGVDDDVESPLRRAMMPIRSPL